MRKCTLLLVPSYLYYKILYYNVNSQRGFAYLASQNITMHYNAAF